ncbi:aldose 1-epimerase [Cohnella sp. 56]|uniref:aldose 1-epimerase n=1 Tax=Cohnella sp. 56 TaxID=3113722 RepID=UPI0030E90C75
MGNSHRFRITTKITDGMNIYTLKDEQSGDSLVLIPEAGFNIVRYRSGGVDVIKQAPQLSDYVSRSSEFGNAVLCPPNYMKAGTFRFDEKVYQFPLNHDGDHLHGELRNQVWEVIDSYEGEESASVTTRLRLENIPGIYSYYPHRLEFELSYHIHRGELRYTGIVRNKGAEAAPFGLGFHPYFAYETGERVTVQFNAEKEYPLEEEPYVQGSPAQTSCCEQLSQGTLVEDISLPPPGFRLFGLRDRCLQAVIGRPDAGIAIHYKTDQTFPYAALFKPAWMNAVSIEPYSCIADAFNSSLPEAERGALSLSPAADLQFRSLLRVRTTG